MDVIGIGICRWNDVLRIPRLVLECTCQSGEEMWFAYVGEQLSCVWKGYCDCNPSAGTGQS